MIKFPESLQAWLNTLSPKDRKRETEVARKNLEAIEAHYTKEK